MADILAGIPASDFTDDIPADHNLGPVLCWISWCLLSVASLALVGRLPSRWMVYRRLDLSDWLMVLTWAGSVVYSSAIQMSYRYGLGRHYQYLNIPLVLEQLRWTYLGQFLSIFNPMTGRLAVIFYLLTLIGKARPGLRHALWALLGLQILMNFSLLGALVGSCGVDLVVIITPGKTCYHASPLSHYTEAVGAFNAFSDLVLAVTPTLLISRLHTTAKAKFGATALLSLNCLALVGAVWRAREAEVLFQETLDFTYNVVPFFVASAVEQNIIIITGSIPTFGPLFRKASAKPTAYSTSHSSRSESSDDADVRHNLAKALGMPMPLTMGNTVTITAGPDTGDEYTLKAMRARTPTISKTMRTQVKVEDSMGYEEDTEQLAPSRSAFKT